MRVSILVTVQVYTKLIIWSVAGPRQRGVPGGSWGSAPSVVIGSGASSFSSARYFSTSFNSCSVLSNIKYWKQWQQWSRRKLWRWWFQPWSEPKQVSVVKVAWLWYLIFDCLFMMWMETYIYYSFWVTVRKSSTDFFLSHIQPNLVFSGALETTIVDAITAPAGVRATVDCKC
jgi:hypothetical protein